MKQTTQIFAEDESPTLNSLYEKLKIKVYLKQM